MNEHELDTLIKAAQDAASEMVDDIKRARPNDPWPAIKAAASAGISAGKVAGSRIRQLEERLAALEAERTRSLADSFKGPWLPQTRYSRGALVQHAGSLWLALDDAGGRPGQSEGWRLLIRGGRDGRDTK